MMQSGQWINGQHPHYIRATPVKYRYLWALDARNGAENNHSRGEPVFSEGRGQRFESSRVRQLY